MNAHEIALSNPQEIIKPKTIKKLNLSKRLKFDSIVICISLIVGCIVFWSTKSLLWSAVTPIILYCVVMLAKLVYDIIKLDFRF